MVLFLAAAAQNMSYTASTTHRQGSEGIDRRGVIILPYNDTMPSLVQSSSISINDPDSVRMVEAKGETAVSQNNIAEK